jgi:hypothetical protein
VKTGLRKNRKRREFIRPQFQKGWLATCPQGYDVGSPASVRFEQVFGF